MPKFSVPCPIPHPEGSHSGYHPLTLARVRGLVRQACRYHIVDPVSFSSIQCRLLQGIPGMLCPRQIEGPIAEKIRDMEEAFMGFFDAVDLSRHSEPYKEFDPSELAERLYAIMNSKEGSSK